MRRKSSFCILLLAIFSGCATITHMKETLDRAEEVIEVNSVKLEEAAHALVDNTKKIREFTLPMKFGFPLFCLAIFLFNYFFFSKILKAVKARRN